MGFAEEYLAVTGKLREDMRSCIAALEPGLIRSTELGVTFEFVKTNAMHILDMADPEEIASFSTTVMEEHMINTDIDHAPEFINELAAITRPYDSAGVLDAAAAGTPHMFVGFHTGPYWTLMLLLLNRGADVVVAMPPALFSRKHEILGLYQGCKQKSGFTGSLAILDIADPHFLIHAREHMSAGRQLLIYIDGYGGYSSNENAKRDVTIPFLGCEITMKTTVTRLAGILGVPVVSFSTLRLGSASRCIYIDPPLHVKQMRDEWGYEHAELTSMLYQRLASRLALAPAQWEGWLYFHVFFSKRHLARVGGQRAAQRAQEKVTPERYFIDKRGEFKTLIDRYTYKAYRLKDKSPQPKNEDQMAVLS